MASLRFFLFGLVAGILGAGVMALPRPDIFITGNAINLSVMASLWLGALLREPVSRDAFIREVIIGAVTLLFVALTFQMDVFFLVAGFALQALWSMRHEFNNSGVSVRPWYPPFATGINGGMALTVLARFGGVI